MPRHSHAMGTKRILRYLNETKDKGTMITSNKEHRVDFAGIFGIEQGQDYISIKSRIEYLITFMGVPLQWVYKL